MTLDRLTPRQRQVAELIAIGYGNKVIAARLGCSVKAVEYHIGAMIDRLALDRSLDVRVQITTRVVRAA